MQISGSKSGARGLRRRWRWRARPGLPVAMGRSGATATGGSGGVVDGAGGFGLHRQHRWWGGRWGWRDGVATRRLDLKESVGAAVAPGIVRWWARRRWWCAVQLLTPAAAPHQWMRGPRRGSVGGQRASSALASRRAGGREGRAQPRWDLGGGVGDETNGGRGRAGLWCWGVEGEGIRVGGGIYIMKSKWASWA
jgi:hypothetical protein